MSRQPASDRGLRHLAALISMLLVAAVVGFAGGAAFATGAETVKIGTSLSPQNLTVAPGTTVSFESADGGRHRFRTTSAPVQLDSGDITATQSWAYTFTTPGTYAYVDDRHKDDPAMHGTVTVGTVATGPSGGGAAPPAPATAAVSLAGKAFNPSSVTVAVGGTVTWTNNDSMPHNVTSASGAFRSTTLQPGQVFTFTFTAPGTYPYSCTLHGGMNGTVIVPAANGSVPPPAPAAAAPAAGAPAAVPGAVAAAPGKPGKHTVVISDAGFTPAALDARAGDTVTWVNNGAMPHTATAAGGAFDLAIEPGASAATVLQAPGTIHYVCSYHPNMVGTITVAAALPGVVIAPPPKQPKTASARTAAGGSRAVAPAAGGAAKSYQVTVQDNSFSPATLNARVGDTVTWTNAGKMPHTVTAQDGSFAHQLAPGQTFSYALRAQGTVAYVCTFHPGMAGTLVVGAPLAGVAVPPADAGAVSSGSAAAPVAAAAPPPASSGKTKTYEIKVQEMSFAPAMQSARVGDTISWVNVGSIPHTVTAADGSFDQTLDPGERFNLVLRKEGDVDYVCTFHPGMDGMLMVGPALAGVSVPAAGSNDAGAAAGPAAPHRHGRTTSYQIQVKDNSFSPAMLEARVGDTVTWVNVGKVPHTVTAKDHSFDAKLAPGKSFTLVLTRQGQIDYVCTPHKGMFGMLMVGPALTGPAPASPPRTIAGLSPVSMAGLSTGWLLVIGLLTAAQLRARANRSRRDRRSPTTTTEDAS